MNLYIFCSCILVLVRQNQGVTAFLPSSTRPTFQTSRYIDSLLLAQGSTPRRKQSNRSPSKVTDLDGPTPEFDPQSLTEIDPSDVPELKDISDPNELPRPIPHQPWRRGDTAGCEAPITEPWRLQAEDVIYKAVEFVGGRVLDVTWYLTSLLVTLDDQATEEMDSDMLKARGPVIDIEYPKNPQFFDPADPNPDDIWAHEDSVLYTRETPEQAAADEQRRNKMYAPKDQDDDPNDPHRADDIDPLGDVSLYMNQESRADVAYHASQEELERQEALERPIDLEHTMNIDTAKLSTIAQAILDALETVEDDLKILERHELILTSPGALDVLESQKQFDAYRNHDVLVETQDPFNSNRTLKGKLVSRNAMDVIINKKGRMVTIPNNFVKCVRLAGVKKERKVSSELMP